MKQHATEIIFRNKLLILLPLLVLVPLSVAFALQPKAKKYQAFVGVWVDQYRPLYQDDRLGNTPAVNQAALMNDFIHTRSFALDVLKQTDLAPSLTTPAAEDYAVAKFVKAVQVQPTGGSFMTVQVVMDNPNLTYQVARGVMTSYQTVLQNQKDAQVSAALSLTSDAVTKAQDSLTQSQKALSDYIASHPQLVSKSTDSVLSPTERDATFARLVDKVASDQQKLDGLQNRQYGIEQDSAAGQQSLPFTLTVVDQPRKPTAPLGTKKVELLKLPAVGMALGLVLSGLVAVLLILTDRTVHGVSDVQQLLGVPVLGEVGELRGYRWPFRRRANALRLRRWFWLRKPRDVVRLRLAAPARYDAGYTIEP